MKTLSLKTVVALFILAILSGCSSYENLNIYGVKDFKFRGIKDGVIYLNLTMDIENQNKKALLIKEMKFETWLNNRPLGKLSNGSKIKIDRNTRKDYDIPLEIRLRTPADAFKLIGKGKNIADEITVKGFIKGGRWLMSKKINIPKQSLKNLANTFQKDFIATDTLSAKPAFLP
ncbi:hypothetical protein [Tenuifilum thalassicum]|uniref:Late embryogenesis abundant protein LEA-2 subgroup domain-containing protein n=1 Tax=Tenuifilum thalassicum TaxID=2590900 RepID=A0A7D3XCK2_9BACT|nr:hypothetical protein [Tenuifilum thalassicum]QKG79112.1 hypothetical protein FHG85_02135 [Tenuifilum thalassicum]